ncbi:MAG TPA: NAD(P)/FAD-dependent oxidoreductase [Crinalium sp.]
MTSSHPTVILGGGFVGLFTALHLRQQNYPHSIVLVDQRDRFTFKPLLYELLTGELHAEQICPSYAELLSDPNLSFVQDSVDSIDLIQKRVVLASGKQLDYGKLVLALGSQTTYFNTPGAADYAFPFATAENAIALRDHLKSSLEKARLTRDPEQRLQLLTVAIIGAGPAGVELACTLADILPVWYDELGGNYEDLRIVLVNRSSDILNGDINSRLRDHAKDSLANRTIPVELLLDAAVTAITVDGVEVMQQGNPTLLPAHTVAWTGGTAVHPLLKTLPIAPENRNRRGQLHVLPTLQLPDFPEVFVGGDGAYVADHPQPATAQVAYQQGKAIADNLRAIADGKPPQPAQIHLRGTLMKLGIGEGIANIFNRFTVQGDLGHLIREATYLELLPTPIHNVKTTAEWLTDELFQRHQPKTIHPDRVGKTPILAGTMAVLAGVMISMPLIWRAAQPDAFQQSFSWTGIPTLLNQLAPVQSK